MIFRRHTTRRAQRFLTGLTAAAALAAASVTFVTAQQAPPSPPPATQPGGPGGFGFARGGPGGPGGFGQSELKVLAKFDKDKNGYLDAEERKEAREFVKKERPQGGRGFGRMFGGPGGPGIGGGGFGGPSGPGGGPTSRPANAAQPGGNPPTTQPFPGPNAPGGPGFQPGGGPGAGGGNGIFPGGGGFGRRGGPGGGGGGMPRMGRVNPEPPKPGPRVSPADVQTYPDSGLFEPTVLRTLFFEFENPDWEAELQDFHNTDVDVPATLVVDGRRFEHVGVHFRGASSYMAVPMGSKRSFSVSINMVDKDARLYGHRTLNLLNAHGDETFLRYPLSSFIGRQFLPTPRSNVVKVVINGESWGVYDNAEHFDKDFLGEWYTGNDKKGVKEARWKVKGSPRGGGGLVYTGDDVSEYKRHYDLKSKDDKDAWKALIELCKVLNETPPDKLEKKLAPILDVDEALRFIAFDLVLMNEDGYWIRDSDFSIYRDAKGKFHILPHDLNETFEQAGGGPPMMFGGRGGPGGASQQPRPTGVALDPLYGLDDASKPLRSKLLKVPALRARYLAYVREMAEKWLDWKNLEPVAKQYVTLIEKEVELDTRKLDTTAAFKAGIFKPAGEPAAEKPGQRQEMSLQQFVEARRAYLLNHPEIKKITSADAGK